MPGSNEASREKKVIMENIYVILIATAPDHENFQALFMETTAEPGTPAANEDFKKACLDQLGRELEAGEDYTITPLKLFAHNFKVTLQLEKLDN